MSTCYSAKHGMGGSVQVTHPPSDGVRLLDAGVFHLDMMDLAITLPLFLYLIDGVRIIILSLPDV